MKYRRNRLSYLVYSLLIHIILVICMWWFSPKNTPQPSVRPGTNIDLVPSPRQPIATPPQRFDNPAPTESETPDVEEVDNTPALPKPKIDLNTDWLNENDRGAMLSDAVRRQETLNGDRTPTDPAESGSSILRNTKIPQRLNTHATTENYNRKLFTLSTSSKSTHETPKADTSRIALDTNGILNSASPTVGTPKINYGNRRGDALRATSMGNSWGGGSTLGGTNAGGIYIKMLKEIARDLTAATTTKKVDIVFVLDETASMVDNIRGIRAYFEFIFEALKRDKRDATYGLVTFTDKTKTYGRTDDLGTFKTWLFKIDVDRGGDISEAGLDALMAAVSEIKFRRDAQRFFIFASDAAFHDADYDGRSPYSLDEVVATLQKQRIRVEVIGLDYLPIKQIAMATGGTWRAIPGKGYLEYVPPITLTVKMLSKLGTLQVDGSTVGDKITVFVNNPPRPKQLTLTWKVLNPLGERCYGPFTEKREIPDDNSTKMELTPVLDTTAFQTIHGIYTVIYRLENDQGHKSILRRTLTYKYDKF